MTSRSNISFHWYRDERGYRIAHASPREHDEFVVKTPVSITVVQRDEECGEDEAPLQILRRGGKSISYEPYPDLFLIFATSVTNPETAIVFADRYGALTHSG